MIPNVDSKCGSLDDRCEGVVGGKAREDEVS